MIRRRHARAIRIGILSRRTPYTDYLHADGGGAVVINFAQWNRDVDAFTALTGRARVLAERARARTTPFTAVTRVVDERGAE